MQEETISLNTGYFICDKRGRFLSTNDILLSLTGYAEEEILELAITDLMSKEIAHDFLTELYDKAEEEETIEFSTEIVDKIGERHAVEIRVRLITDESSEAIIGFRGNLIPTPSKQNTLPARHGQVDQAGMIEDLINIIHLGYSEPLAMLLKRVSESICQVFGFKRSTIALLDRRRRVFVKQAMVGYSSDANSSIERRAIEVPQEVIDRIFSDRYKIKVIYHNQDQRDAKNYLTSGMPERRSVKRLPEDQWHKRDLILLNLMDHQGNTFGYISLDDPLDNTYPTRTTFHNLELFAAMISMAIENYYRFSTLERRNRRLKQMLVNSNIFKLYLSLNELLKEVVWSVKFSLDFNFVSLVLISKKSGLLETKAVACDDKIKLLQVREIKYDLKEFSDILRDEYRQGRSYFIINEESVLRHLKQIYYGSRLNKPFRGGWPVWGLILVPIKSCEGKIIGFLLADDPLDNQMPTRETIGNLEIMANQIAIAIDNRVMYVQAKERLDPNPPEESAAETEKQVFEEKEDDYAGGGLRKLVEKFLR
ncbi:PAS domain-containing protein [candidate division KSB1 bacterium]|nr:PAS domain-containing protein [candidate division KSB1 bacterium]